MIWPDEMTRLYLMGKSWMNKAGRYSPSAISQKPRREVVAEYLLSKVKLVVIAGETSTSPQLKAVVPCLYYPRYKVTLSISSSLVGLAKPVSSAELAA